MGSFQEEGSPGRGGAGPSPGLVGHHGHEHGGPGSAAFASLCLSLSLGTGASQYQPRCRAALRLQRRGHVQHLRLIGSSPASLLASPVSLGPAGRAGPSGA